MVAGRPPTPAQLAREHSLRFAMTLDAVLMAAVFCVGLIGGSLTLIAECVRGALMLGTEVFALIAMRRIHRGLLAELEFGYGKLEQIANLTIAIGMVIGATWICWGAVALLFGERPPPSPVGLAAAAMFIALNTYLNFVAWIAVLQATPPGSPVIMEAQLRSRSVKVLSSCVVLVLLTISALCLDPVIATWCDVLGALFVAGFILVTAADMARGGLPDLLDRCANEAVQRGINRALCRRFDDFEQLGRIRSRRSGKTIFIEVALGFDPRLTIAELDRRVRALRAAFAHEIADADVSILISSPAEILDHYAPQDLTDPPVKGSDLNDP